MKISATCTQTPLPASCPRAFPAVPSSMKPEIETIPTHMKLHATRKNLALGAPDQELGTCALDSSRSLPFIAPLRLRWSPVVLQRKIPSISFLFTPLQDSSSHNEGGTPLSPHLFPVSPLACPERSRGATCLSRAKPRGHSSLSLAFATHPKNACITLLLATLPKTQVLKVLCLPHIQKLAGWGSYC